MSEFQIRLRPRYGWGWTAPRGEPAIEYEQIDRFGSFELSVSGVFQFQGQYRGFYGEVTEKEYPLGGLRFILWSMCGSDPDLRESEDTRWDLFFDFLPEKISIPIMTISPIRIRLGLGMAARY